MQPTRRDLLKWLPAAMALVKCTPQVQQASLKFLSATEAAYLNALADQVLPPDGSSLGVVAYVDRLVSGNDVLFSSLGVAVPLDRLAQAAWSMRVEALKPAIRTALSSDKPIEQLSSEDRELVCSLVTEAAFARPEYGGNPKNAGSKLIGSAGAVMPEGFVKWNGTKNVEQADAPVSTAETGTDAFPIDQWTRDLLDEVTRATGGRIA